MQPTTGAALSLNSMEKVTGDQDVRVDAGNGAPVRLIETRGGKVAEDKIIERKDSLQVLNGSVTDCSDGEEEKGSFSEGENSLEHEDNLNSPGGCNDKLDNDDLPLPDVDRVFKQEHANSECQFTSPSSIFFKSANSSGSRARFIKFFSSSCCAGVGRSCFKCNQCNGTGTFPGKADGDCRATEKSLPVGEDENGLLLVEGSKPRPTNQRPINVSEISWGMWLKCFVRFVVASIVEDLVVTSNPLLTSYNVILLPISFVLCFFSDMAFFVVAVFYDLVFVAVYILLCILWALNGVVALCWNFFQLASFSTRVAKLIFEFTWDMRAAYKDDVHCCKCSSR